MRMKIRRFKVLGTATGSKKSKQLDEISIVADPETLMRIGVFLINAANEMRSDEINHVHFQDVIKNFSYEKHADIIAHVRG